MAMATAKSSLAAEINEIQRRMAQVRHDLHEDVREAVKGAQSLTDWRSQVGSHPWLALGAAAVLGYAIVPRRRRPELPAVVALGPPSTAMSAVAPAAVSPSSPPSKGGWGIVGAVLSLAAPIAVRAAQNYAIQYLEQWLVSQQSTGPGPAGAGRGSGPAMGPRPASNEGPHPSSPFGDPGRPRDRR